jgi:hypothetical protein
MEAGQSQGGGPHAPLERGVPGLGLTSRTTENRGRNEGPNLSAGQNQENLSGT